MTAQSEHDRVPVELQAPWRAAAGSAGATALVSRAAVVARVQETLAAGRSVLVVGDAGVGKTEVASAALARLRRLDDSGVGEQPVVTISGAGRDEFPLAALEPLLGDDGLLTLGSFARTARALAASLAVRGPVVLRVEDAHLLDDASARALAWLVRQRDVVLVATLRSSALAGSAWLPLWRDGAVERVDLEPFSRAEVEQWLGATLGGPVEPDTVRRMWRATGGNAFHLAELVRGEAAAGILARRDGAWAWEGHAAPSARLLDVVAHDIARLSAAGRDALEVAALAGPVPLSLYLEEVPHAALDEVMRHGLVAFGHRRSTSGAGEVLLDVAHGLYAEAVAAVVPRARRRAVLERFLETPGAPRPAAALVRIVALALGSDVDVPHRRLLDAVDAAFALREPTTVVELVTSALEQRAPGEERWLELMLRRADAWWQLHDAERADRDLDAIAAALRARDRLDDAHARVVVAAASMRAGIVHDRDDDFVAAVGVLDAARAHLADAGAHPDHLRALDVARLSRLAYGGATATLDDALGALAAAPGHAGTAALAGPTVLGLSQVGRFGAALDLVRRYAPVARSRADRHRWGAGELDAAAFVATLLAGDVAGARALALASGVEVADPAERPRDELTTRALVPAPRPGRDEPEAAPPDASARHVAAGLLAVADGAWSRALGEFHAANVRLAGGGRGGGTAFTHAAEALAAAASGAAAEARALLSAADTLPLRSTAALGAELRLMRLDTLAWLRDERLGAEAALLVASARERGLPRIELEALHRLLERNRPHGLDGAAVARVAELGAVVEGPRAAAIVRRVAALERGDDDLARIAERELNRCGLWLAPVAVPVALTRREAEIAALAAGGMTSRAIATRLTLSVRTVDSHLARVFAKAGVHSREELAAVLR